jgi:predicted nucleic acid-binding protein
MTAPAVGLLDTSVFIARESGRRLDKGKVPQRTTVSVVTLAELEAGVLAAADVDTRARRLRTLEEVARITDPVLIDSQVAKMWARLRAHLAEKKRRVNVNDLWIAASAVANGLPIVTQDDGFDPLIGVAGLTVVRV